MKQCISRIGRGGTLVLKKGDDALCRQIRELGGDKVGVVSIDVSKARICALMKDFYGNVLKMPEVFPVTAAGLAHLETGIAAVQRERDLSVMLIGLEQTGRLHEPIRRVLPR